MKTKTKAVGLLGLMLAVTGCATTGLNSNTGPSLVMVATEAVQASPGTKAEKMGKACSMNVLGIVSSGDSSIQAAKINGGITEVASVDREITNVLFIYGSNCTVVRGN